MFGLYNIQKPGGLGARLSGPARKWGVFAVVAVMLGMNAVYMVERFKKDRPLDYLSGKLTRDEYLPN
jgi:predicted metallopeptidase